MSSAHLSGSQKISSVPVTPQGTALAADETESEASSFSLSPKIILDWIYKNLLKTWFVSFAVHIIAVLLLALITLVTIPEKEISLLLENDPSPDVQMLVPLEIDLSTEETELDSEMAEASENLIEMEPFDASVPVDFGELAWADTSMEMSDFSELDFSELVGDEGKGEAFFSNGPQFKTAVFVVDNSNSMSKGRLETALVELQETISRMTKKQKFYILFYSDSAYPLFYPRSAKSLIPATEANKAKVANWLLTIEMCLKTNGYDAITYAASLKPDVIYVLGDGAFTDKVPQKLKANPLKNVVVHTLGMEVKPANVAQFRQIAKLHNGTYRDVGVSEKGRQLLRAMGPRKRNSIKGKIWGKALPKTKK